jgi:DNA-binding CsgD family transcriptional regulator
VQARSPSSPQRGLDLLYESLAAYERLPPSPGHVKALRDAAGILRQEGRQAEAAALIDQGATVAERAGLPSAMVEIGGLRAWNQMTAGAGDVALQQIAALRERLTAQDEPGLHIRMATCHSDILLELGRLAEVETVAAPVLQLATEHGIDGSFSAAMLRANTFDALTELGKIDEAGSLIDPVTQGHVSTINRLDYEARATLEMLRGNLDEGKQRWLGLRGLPRPSLTLRVWSDLQETELHCWRQFPRLAFDQGYGALELIAGADQATLSGPMLTVTSRLLVLALRACADLAEQARADHDPDAADAAQRRADRLSDLHRGMAPDPFTAGPLRPTAAADHATWQAEESRLHGESDPALWERAAEEWDALARPHRAAYARWRQGEAVLADPGGRTAAAEVLQTAARQAAQHVPLSGAIHDLARRARIDLTGTTEQPAQDTPIATVAPFGLTDRELAVLELLARGKTNSQIGAALFISRKTASVHVTNILRKLGVTTRVQAAAVAERAGLLLAD